MTYEYFWSIRLGAFCVKGANIYVRYDYDRGLFSAWTKDAHSERITWGVSPDEAVTHLLKGGKA